MAGAFPDAPSRRMAWDADGSIGLYYTTGGASSGLFSPSERVILNNEAEDRIDISSFNIERWLAVIFPEDREVDGVFTAYQTGSYARTFTAIDTSADTLTGYDGSWTQRIANIVDYTTVISSYREDVTSMAVSGVAGLRGYQPTTFGDMGTKAFHIYGSISPLATPDRILYLDTENSDAVFSKTLDYGDVPRGQTQVRTIKIKNNSGSKIINTIQVTAEDLYLNAGGWYTFSLDNVSFQATLNTIGNLGPGDTKLIYVKQIIPDAELLGLQAGRIRTSHDSLT